ncbi:MAG TPA: hypothetical protein VL970_15815, partial [Candidatus Acidoferrales bacterium]|nr:hypothetical protein [Candidatus Acidoferrales bacterium]
MNFGPIFAMIELGSRLFVLLVVGLGLIGLIAVPVAGTVAIVYFLTRRGKTKAEPAPIQPAPPAPVSSRAAQAVPLAAKTVILPRHCPQCGAALQPDAPEGLCPACLLQRGFATEAGSPPGQTSFVPPALDELAKLFPQLEILECL